MNKSYYLTVREQLESYRKDELNLSELLSVIIGSHSIQPVCQELGRVPAQRLLEMTRDDFMKFEGINKVIGSRLEAAMTLVKRLSKQDLPERYIIRSPEDGARNFDYLKYETQEHFVVSFLNTKNHVLATKSVFKGSLNASIVHPREVFKEALYHSAASIVVAHNHPSGDPTPSREDIEVTKRLAEVGKLIGIELLDHIIIGHNKFVSLKEKGYL